jgi:hypothetical protein
MWRTVGEQTEIGNESFLGADIHCVIDVGKRVKGLHTFYIQMRVSQKQRFANTWHASRVYWNF